MPNVSREQVRIGRAVAIASAVLLPIAALMLWVSVPIQDCLDAHWTLQTAGSVDGAAGLPIGSDGCDVGTSLVIDLALILGYVAVFTFVIDRGGRLLRSLPSRRAANRLRWLPVVVGVLDVIENAMVAQWALPDGFTADYQARWVAAVSAPRWALTLVVLFMVAAAIWALADDR